MTGNGVDASSAIYGNSASVVASTAWTLQTHHMKTHTALPQAVIAQDIYLQKTKLPSLQDSRLLSGNHVSHKLG